MYLNASVDPSSETPPSVTNKTDLIPSYEEMIGQVRVRYILATIIIMIVYYTDFQC